LFKCKKILDSEGVLVLGATNRPFDLDPAVRRRFEKRIYVPLPDAEGRLQLLKLHLGNEAISIPDEFYKQFSKDLEGYSGSDISALAREILMTPIRIATRATHWKEVNNGFFIGSEMSFLLLKWRDFLRYLIRK